MDNEQIVNRLIDILNSQNSNLLIGNITSPRPGSICQVSTSYGIKSAYNINCTYPGNAIVVWDKDEKQYYCFTNNPSTVLSSRKLSYRKNREIPIKNKLVGGFVLLMDATMYLSFGSKTNLNLFFEDVLEKLDYNKKLYVALPTLSGTNFTFFGNTVQNFWSGYYNELATYLSTKEVVITNVIDTELNKVDSVLWMPLFNGNAPISFTNTQLNTLKNIGIKYGIILQGENNINPFLNSPAYYYQHNLYYLDKYYNPYTTKKIVQADLISTGINDFTTLLYSNLGNSKDLSFFQNLTGLILSSKIPQKNRLTRTSGGYGTDINAYCNALYWQIKG